MPSPRDVGLILVLAVGIVGCRSPQAASPQAPSAQAPLPQAPSPAPPTASPAIEAPAPSADPGVAAARYTCDAPPGFPLGVFDQPAVAELEFSPSAESLRVALNGELPADVFPRSGYWLVGRGAVRADYVARSAGGGSPFAYATFEVHDGAWSLAGYGECRPTLVLDGLDLATWTLDPDLPRPGPAATTVTALVTERACTGGKPMGARLRPPTIERGEDAITIVFSVRPLAGGHDCPGNPSTRVVVKLGEALGDRRLLDGAFFPPADPGAPDS